MPQKSLFGNADNSLRRERSEEQNENLNLPAGKTRIFLYICFILLIMLLASAFLVEIPYICDIEGTLEAIEDIPEGTKLLITAAMSKGYTHEQPSRVTLLLPGSDKSFSARVINQPAAGEEGNWQICIAVSNSERLILPKKKVILRFNTCKKPFAWYLLN